MEENLKLISLFSPSPIKVSGKEKGIELRGSVREKPSSYVSLQKGRVGNFGCNLMRIEDPDPMYHTGL